MRETHLEICVCEYVYVCIHSFTYTCVCEYTHIFTCIYVFIVPVKERLSRSKDILVVMSTPRVDFSL